MRTYERAILVAAIILASAILLNGGIYKYETVQVGVVHKYNVFTGSVELCIQKRGCNNFEDSE